VQFGAQVLQGVMRAPLNACSLKATECTQIPSFMRVKFSSLGGEYGVLEVRRAARRPGPAICRRRLPMLDLKVNL